mgnify:CR=1 FL=1
MNKKLKTPHLSKKTQQQLMRWASYCSVATAIGLIIVKIISFFMTNSLALLSSLMDSGLDLGASVVSLIAIHQALVPADKEHRFGHGKAEALGGLIQGVIICLSGLFLLYETAQQILHPEPLQRLDVGFAVMVLSIIVTIALVSFQKFVIRETNSLAVDADSAHYTGDVMMNIGVIISMCCSYLLGWRFMDPLFAGIVAVYLFYCAYGVITKAQSILMDKELPLETRKQIKDIVLKHDEVNNIHDLRTRNAGMNSFVQFSIALNGEQTLQSTHDLCDKLEKELKQNLPDSEVFIHPEPDKKN